MSAKLDEIAPATLRDRKFDLELDQTNTAPAARQSILINVSYARSYPAGPSAPLIFEAQGPSPGSYFRQEYDDPPATIVWTPVEGGPHQLTLREAAHNYWYGVLRTSVSGGLLAPVDAL